MTRKTDLSILEPFLSLEQYEWADVVRFRDDVLALAEVPDALDNLRLLREDLERCPCKALVFWSTEHSFSPERCNVLLRNLGDLHKRNAIGDFTPGPLCGLTMMREENVFGGLIPWLRSVKRPVIMVFQGNVSLSFLGIGLACDCRIATSDTTFYNQGRDYDMPSGAGLLYLLPAYIGLGRATSLVTRATEVSAHSALKLGLLDEVAMSSELDQAVQNISVEISRFSSGTLDTIKQLLNQRLPDFNTYLTIETEGLDKALRGKPWEKLPDCGTKAASL